MNVEKKKEIHNYIIYKRKNAWWDLVVHCKVCKSLNNEKKRNNNKTVNPQDLYFL